MEIRERRADDLDELVAVATRVREVDSYPMFLPDGDFVRFLTRPTPVDAWVAVEGDELVGHVALHDTTSKPVMRLVAERRSAQPPVYVARLLVDPDWRGHGLGRRLLEHARGAAVDAGHTPFLDVVDAPATAAAIGLYRSDGWVEIGRVTYELLGGDIDELVFQGPLAAPASAVKQNGSGRAAQGARQKSRRHGGGKARLSP